MTRFVPAILALVLTIGWPMSLNSEPPTTVGRAMADAAAAFLNHLDPEQRSKATFDFNDDSRFEFRFTPRARTGLPLKEMTEAQREIAHTLLRTGLSLGGYTKAQGIIDLENVLRVIEAGRAGPVRDPELYYLLIYGTQGPTFLVEYDNVQNDANHIHSVWRDFDGDFGRDLLREHYRAVPHGPAGHH